MISFVETVFGVSALALLTAVVLAVRGRRQLARRFGLAGGAAALLAIVLEVSLRTFA